MNKPIKLPPPEEHWKLTHIIEKRFGSCLSSILEKVPQHLHHETLRLIADECYARMEKLEEQNKSVPKLD